MPTHYMYKYVLCHGNLVLNNLIRTNAEKNVKITNIETPHLLSFFHCNKTSQRCYDWESFAQLHDIRLQFVFSGLVVNALHVKSAILPISYDRSGCQLMNYLWYNNKMTIDIFSYNLYKLNHYGIISSWAIIP